MRSSKAWVLVWCGLQGAALLAACSASPGASYAIPDDDIADDDVGSDATVSPSDATVADAVADREERGDAEAGTPTEDADADAEVDAAADAEAEEASTDASDDAAADVDAGPPPPPLSLLRLEGRWDRSLPDTPRTAFPGARITLHFTGTGATLRLRERTSYRSFEGTSQWSVTVDGAPQAVLVTEVTAGNVEETRDYPLAAGLAAGEHTIQLVRRTEAEFGSTRLVDVLVTDGTMLAPPARLLRRVELVGDSNMSGYGIETTRPMNPGDPPCSHTPTNQNFEKTFPWLLAMRFGAEIETAIHSGKGVFYNQTRTDLTTLPVLYPRAIPSEPATLYDASAFAADAVVVLAGGNDFAERADNDYPSEADVRTAYDGLIGQIRAAHPTALIFATLSPGIGDGSPIYVAPHPQQGQSVMVRSKVRTLINDIVSARTLAGDQKLFFHELAEAGGDQLTACHYHPSPALHASLASSIGDVMAAHLSW